MMICRRALLVFTANEGTLWSLSSSFHGVSIRGQKRITPGFRDRRASELSVFLIGNNVWFLLRQVGISLKTCIPEGQASIDTLAQAQAQAQQDLSMIVLLLGSIVTILTT